MGKQWQGEKGPPLFYSPKVTTVIFQDPCSVLPLCSCCKATEIQPSAILRHHYKSLVQSAHQISLAWLLPQILSASQKPKPFFGAWKFRLFLLGLSCSFSNDTQTWVHLGCPCSHWGLNLNAWRCWVYWAKPWVCLAQGDTTQITLQATFIFFTNSGEPHSCKMAG